MIKLSSRLIRTLTLLSFSVILVSAGCGNTSGKQETKAPQPKSADPGWVLLFDGETLDGWEVTQFGTQGPVQVSGGSVVLGMGDGCSGITWKGEFPKMNYEVKLEAKKVTGNDFFSIFSAE